MPDLVLQLLDFTKISCNDLGFKVNYLLILTDSGDFCVAEVIEGKAAFPPEFVQAQMNNVL